VQRLWDTKKIFILVYAASRWKSSRAKGFAFEGWTNERWAFETIESAKTVSVRVRTTHYTLLTWDEKSMFESVRFQWHLFAGELFMYDKFAMWRREERGGGGCYTAISLIYKCLLKDFSTLNLIYLPQQELPRFPFISDKKARTKFLYLSFAIIIRLLVIVFCWLVSIGPYWSAQHELMRLSLVKISYISKVDHFVMFLDQTDWNRNRVFVTGETFEIFGQFPSWTSEGRRTHYQPCCSECILWYEWQTWVRRITKLSYFLKNSKMLSWPLTLTPWPWILDPNICFIIEN